MKKREWVFDKDINIYVLKLENGCFYVGQLIDVNRRIEEHRQKRKGANFTKLNAVVSLDAS